MKKLQNITKRIKLITGIAMGALIITSTLASAEPHNKTPKDEVAETNIKALEAEVLAQLEEDELILAEFEQLNVPMVKIFNANDELVYEAVVDDFEMIKDQKLLSLMHKSDFLMNFENVSYYQLGE